MSGADGARLGLDPSGGSVIWGIDDGEDWFVAGFGGFFALGVDLRVLLTPLR